MKMVGGGELVDFGGGAFLRAHAAREIAEVVNRQR